MKSAALLLALQLLSVTAVAQSQFTLGSRPAARDGPSKLFGIWGTGLQCDAHRQGEQTNPALLPYEIGNDWLRQGFIYCYLSWFEPEKNADGIRIWANAQCGEDTIRDYRLHLNLDLDQLQIRWSDDFSTGELQRCGAADELRSMPK